MYVVFRFLVCGCQYQCSRLPGMTYLPSDLYVSNWTLNPAHSLNTYKVATIIIACVSTLCLIKTANLFLSELHQISTNFDNFWQKDGKEAKIMQDAEMHSLSASLNSRHHTTVLNTDVPNCYATLKVVICNKLYNGLISTQ